MLANANRARYDRSRLRYPSDLTNAEWAHVAPLIPPAKRGGNRRHIDERGVVNGLMYILSTGCQWRAIPKDLPARSTLYNYFDPGVGWANRRSSLREVPRGGRARRTPPPRSSTARASRAQKRGARIGYDAGKRINGKKRRILVDTQGLLMHAIVHAADIRDRDGGATGEN